jgi:hypothetical protein
MRHLAKHTLRTAAPVYCFDTDVSIGRALRDPMQVLLGRSSLSVVNEPRGCDPYNRVGRWMRSRFGR